MNKYIPQLDDIRPIEPPKYRGLLDLEKGVLMIYRDDKNGTADLADLFNQLQKKDGERNMTREEAINTYTSNAEYERTHGNLQGCLDFKQLAEWLKELKRLKEQEPILDKIRAEIKEWYWQADKQALAKDPCVVDAMIDLFIRTIDKYKAESEESNEQTQSEEA